MNKRTKKKEKKQSRKERGKNTERVQKGDTPKTKNNNKHRKILETNQEKIQ